MTLAEKIGQMTQIDRGSLESESDIAAYALGSILSGGGSTPDPDTPVAWADMVDRYQRAALSTRLGIPILCGVDAVHGHGNVLGATVFPHNLGLGAARDPRLVQEVARATAEELAGTGVRWDFAPSAPCSRCRRPPGASSSPGRARTTSGTRRAAGPSRGRGRAATSSPARRSSVPSGTPSRRSRR